MQSSPAFALLLVLTLLSGCDGCGTYSKLKTTTSGGVTRIEAEICGEGAQVTADGDLLEIRDAEIWVNGKSLGPVGSRHTVEYVIDGSRRELLVDGTVRTTAAR